MRSFILILLLIIIISNVVTVKKKKTRKTKATNDESENDSDSNTPEVTNEHRTLQNWLDLRREVLLLSCNIHHLNISGSHEVVANRLYNYFHPAAVQAVSVSRRPNSRKRTKPPSNVPPLAHPPSTSDHTAASITEIVRNELLSIMSSPDFHASRRQELPTVDITNQNINPQNGAPFDHSISVPANRTRTNQNINFQNGDATAPPPETLTDRPNYMRPTDTDRSGIFSGPSSLTPAAPRRVIQQVRAGEYVNFNHLLPSHTAASKEDYSIKVGAGNSAYSQPSLSLVPRVSKSNKVHDLNTWLTAWNTYARIYIHFYPGFADQLLYYQTQICRYSTQYDF